MIDGVAVSEPNVNPVYDKGVRHPPGSGAPLAAHSRPLIDYTTLVNVYQGCANSGGATARRRSPRSWPPTRRSPPAPAPAWPSSAWSRASRPRSRRPRRSGRSTATASCRSRTSSSRPTGCSGRRRASASPTPTPTRAPRWPTTSAATPSPRPRRASPYQPVALPAAADAVLFGLANGIPPTGRGPARQRPRVRRPARNDVSVSAGLNRQDQNLPGASVPAVDGGTGNLPSRPRSAPTRSRSRPGPAGYSADLADGQAARHPDHHRPRPQRRADRPEPHLAPLLRAEPAARRQGEARSATTRSPTAQHLDAFNGFPDFADRLIPLHVYFIQALDLMYAHLTGHDRCRRARSSAPRRAARPPRRSRPPTCRRSPPRRPRAT